MQNKQIASISKSSRSSSREWVEDSIAEAEEFGTVRGVSGSYNSRLNCCLNIYSLDFKLFHLLMAVNYIDILKSELESYIERYEKENIINEREILKIKIKELELEINWKLTDELRYLFSWLLHTLKNHEYHSAAIPWYRYLEQKKDMCKKYNISF